MDNLHQWERAFTHVTVHLTGNKTTTFDLTGIRLYQQFLDRLPQAAAPDQALVLAGRIDEVIDLEYDPLPCQLVQSFRLASEHDFDVFQQVAQHAHAFATREVNFIFHYLACDALQPPQTDFLPSQNQILLEWLKQRKSFIATKSSPELVWRQPFQNQIWLFGDVGTDLASHLQNYYGPRYLIRTFAREKARARSIFETFMDAWTSRKVPVAAVFVHAAEIGDVRSSYVHSRLSRALLQDSGSYLEALARMTSSVGIPTVFSSALPVPPTDGASQHDAIQFPPVVNFPAAVSQDELQRLCQFMGSPHVKFFHTSARLQAPADAKFEGVAAIRQGDSGFTEINTALWALMVARRLNLSLANPQTATAAAAPHSDWTFV